METPEVTMFGANAQGERMSSFKTAIGLTVTVKPNDRDANETAFEYACALARQDLDTARSRATIAGLESEVDDLKRKLDAARADLRDLTKPTPARLLGTGYVRFQGRTLWVLGKRETGFAAFGYRCDSWDELFRRFNVHVTDHGTDEHGPWWAVENT